jgi:hypothetical protein
LNLPVEFGGYGRDLSRLMMVEFLWIPIALYAGAAIVAILAYVFLKGTKKKETVVIEETAAE